MSKIIFTENRTEDSTRGLALLRWNQWNPGLDNDHLTMGEVIQSLPQAPPDAIPWQVKLLENDEWWTSFPGAISLARHDRVHVLLGRGLMPQDEAFVIGFTMGAAKHCKGWQYQIFRIAAKNFYPHPYRFTRDHMIAFDLAFARGTNSDASNLEYFPFERFMDYTVGDLRKRLGINHHQLRAIYRHEQILLPTTRESRRLDIDWKRTDPSSIYVPDGEPIDPADVVK